MAENLQFNLDVSTEQAVSSINKFFNTVEQGAAEAKSSLNKAFGQELETEVVIKIEGGKAVAQKVQAVKQESNRLHTVTKAINGEFGKTPNQIRRSISALKAVRDNTEKFNKKTGEVRYSWRLVTEQIDKANRELQEFNNSQPRGSGAASGVKDLESTFTSAGLKARLLADAIQASMRTIQAAIGGMVDRARELGQLNVALQSFTDSAEQAEGIMLLAQQTGLQYGVSIQSVEKAWKRVGPAASAAGLSTKETSTLIESATARIAQMGLSAEQSGRYMEALAQVMGKGKLQGEELRQQFAELDGALRTQVGKYLAVNNGINDLDKAMQNGEVSAQMFAQALIGVSEDAVKKLGTDVGNLNTQWNQLNLEQKFNQVNNVFTTAADQWGDLFGPFMDSVGRAAVLIGGYLATWQTKFPELATILKENMTRAGELIEMVAYGIIIAFDLISKAIEDSRDVLANWLKLIPVVGPAISIIDGLNKDSSGLWSESVEKARALVGQIGNMQQVYGGVVQEQINMATAITEEERARRGLIGQLESQRTLIGELARKQKDAVELQKKTKSVYDAEKQELDSLVANIKARFDLEISKSKDKEAILKDQAKAEKARYKEIREALKERYDEEKTELSDIYDRKLRAMDREKDHLNDMTPSEQKLYDLEKKELIEKIRSGDVDEKQLLTLKARLERMERSEQLDKLAADRKIVEEQKQKALKELEDEKTKALEDAKTVHESILNTTEKALKEQQDQTKELQAQKKEIGDLGRGVEVYNGSLEDGLNEVRNQAVAVQGLKGDWDNATSAVDDYVQKLKDAKVREANLAKAVATDSVGQPARASGGPVVAGSKYTVNELGKEAFLSASGRLSMINAPSYGTWKAPSSGTVIPAHLTKKLDIPTGGANINNAALLNGSMAGRRGISTVSNGDTISNNVTIQTQNPIQAASDMMVQMNKVRRRRYT